jgi:hypothetical protein
LEDFREGGTTRETYWFFTTFDVVALAGSSELTQSECLLGQP